MDWNRDGRVDGLDMVHFHEVINSDSNNNSGTSHSPAAEVMAIVIQVYQMTIRQKE